jgi:DNA-binding GntR family transcriptional regulator
LGDALRRLEEAEQSLADMILADRAQRRIEDVQSVSALARKYGASRHSVLNALKVLSQDGIVTQLPGRAWAFQPLLDSPRAVDESLTFRMALEPDAILAPGFALDRKKSEVIRRRGLELLALPEGRLSAAGFLRADCEFHSFIADCSANRFARGSLLAHHRLRRATQKAMSLPEFRLRQAVEEHLGILDSLERNEFDLAADQMVLHLRRSRSSRPDAANRGAPPLMRSLRA